LHCPVELLLFTVLLVGVTQKPSRIYLGTYLGIYQFCLPIWVAKLVNT